MPYEMLSPSPVPRTPLVLTNGSKMVGTSSGAIPDPLSSTTMVTRSQSSARIETRSLRSPTMSARACLAFVTRLSSTCWS